MGSDKFKKQPVVDKYQAANAILIDIQVYTAGLPLTNQIAEAAVRHGATMFYFLILNLLPKHYSSLCNIDLLASCKSKDVKEKSGQDAMLQVIVDELRFLETNEFELEIPNMGVFRVYVRMLQFTADNLAVHEIFGLIESFSHDYCCALCYCTREEMQIAKKMSFFTLRTRESHALDLAGLHNVQPGCHVRGVKYDCVFNQLLAFYSMDNWINDCMHTLFEGVITYVLGLAIAALIAEKYVTVGELNDRMAKLESSLKVERKNKPCEIKYTPTAGVHFSKMSSIKL